MLLEYKNEPFTNYLYAENKNAMEEAFKKIDSEKGKEYPLIIGGEKVYTEEKIVSINPSNFNEVIGCVSKANVELAEKAVQEALKAFETWKNVSPKERANYLFNVAAIMRRRKHEFSALLVEEAGKIWAEADADTAEAIDFLEYYGRQMLSYEKGMTLAAFEGEQNECNYIPLGVGFIVAPWNFPLAILVGMTAAAIVAGNTVVMKPASATPIIAGKFMELLEEVSLPKGVVNFIPGPGGQIGDYLSAHPQIRFINFTGSMEVGLRINKMAAELAPKQKWIKRVIAEMGGKDTMVIDSDTDLEEAAKAIVTAAFGFQGQKCSACSRAVIVEDVYDEMVNKIAELTKKLKIGPAREFGMNMTAVIDHSAYKKILEYIEIGKGEGRIVVGGSKCGENGYFIEPTVIADIKPEARISQEEIFGPVLAVIKATDFENAIEIANNTVYGLTGAVFTRNRSKIEKAKRDFHVGNLYINRKCTGALVGTEPFGGFNMSGTDSKAGGTDYLLLFMQAKTIGEKF